MGATEVQASPPLRTYDATQYQSTHVQGGAIMGSSPKYSVVNNYLQHWQMPNLFVMGASSFPQNASANPTLTVLAVSLSRRRRDRRPLFEESIPIGVKLDGFFSQSA